MEKEITLVENYEYLMELLKKPKPDYFFIESIINEEIRELAIYLDKKYKNNFVLKLKNYIRLGLQNNREASLRLKITLNKLFYFAMLENLEKSIEFEIFYNKTTKGVSNYWDKAYLYYNTQYLQINKAYEYLQNNSISTQNFEKLFNDGIFETYEIKEKNYINLIIITEKIKNKFKKVFFINTLYYIEQIIKEQEKEEINQKNILELLIKCRDNFEKFSYSLNNNEIKKIIKRKLGKTLTIKQNKNYIISNIILYLLYDKIILNFNEISNKIDNSIELIKLYWESYLFYQIFDFNFEQEMSAKNNEILNNEWEKLLELIENKENSIEDIENQISNIINVFNPYITILKENAEKIN